MNTVLLICYNNVDMTAKAIHSIRTQDIPIDLVVINNGSTDGTEDYLNSLAGVDVFHYPANISPLKLANENLKMAFRSGAEQVLSIPNDATFPPNLYSELLKFDYHFVSAGMACEQDPPPSQTARMLHHDCHFAVWMTRKQGYEAVVSHFGYFFDEDYFHYASDCDMKQRWRQIGIQGCQTDIQCWHYGSASWRTAEPSIQRDMLAQADRDRETYFKKWGERL